MEYIENYKEKRFGYDFYADIAEQMVEGRSLKGWTQADLAKAAPAQSMGYGKGVYLGGG